MKPKTFDAVIESRRWKAAVAQKTESMSREQVLEFFDKDKALAALAKMRQAAPQRAKAHA
ncbi:MAG TPA: hypothetical protein PLB55_21205 [Prosthecobacter sp.]|nr:hypothetical protein [Prosthecobacter sp.]